MSLYLGIMLALSTLTVLLSSAKNNPHGVWVATFVYSVTLVCTTILMVFGVNGFK